METKRFILSPHRSRCCKAAELLVKSTEGGVVKRNCVKCNTSLFVSLADLPVLDCENCGSRLKGRKSAGVKGNYQYVCENESCERIWNLPELLPSWEGLR